MTLERLETAEKVIEALGGRAAVMALTDANSTNAVGNWEREGEFPSRLFLLMSESLKAKGKTAPASLWKMAEPVHPERAA